MKTYLLLLTGWICLSMTAFGQTPRLEIHHIGAGDGDGTLIIAIDTVNVLNIAGQKFLDTSIILIDGQRSGGGKEVWRYVRDTVNALSPTLKKINYIIVSHLHVDHYGGIPRIISSAKQAGWTIGQVIDRQNADYEGYNSNIYSVLDSCYSSLQAIDPDAAAFKNYNDTLKKYNLFPTQAVNIAQNLFPKFEKIYMFCVVAYGLTTSAGNGTYDTCFLPLQNKAGKNVYTPKSENDLSIGFLIRFEGYNYLTSGDLGGVSGGGYVNGETPMTNGIRSGLKFPTDYHICSNKVSHHGSQESTSTWFATTNNFTVSVIPACLRSYGTSNNALPTQTAIQNLQSTGTNNLLYTFIPNNPQTLASYWTKGNLNMYNDVIIKILGAPGYGQNINMTIIQRPKTKKYVYQGTGTVQTITCNKGHNW
jgi:hypothetical protein